MSQAKRGVSIKEVEDAVQRSLESAEWAKQTDDARALECLKSFLTSQGARSLLYVHLVALQPEIFNPKEEDLAMKSIPRNTVCQMFEEALRGASSSDIIDTRFAGLTQLGSAKYELVSCINPTATIYIRMCRGKLRGEMREDDFLIRPEEFRRPAPKSPKGLMSFLKKVLTRP